MNCSNKMMNFGSVHCKLRLVYYLYEAENDIYGEYLAFLLLCWDDVVHLYFLDSVEIGCLV